MFPLDAFSDDGYGATNDFFNIFVMVEVTGIEPVLVAAKGEKLSTEACVT